MSTKVVTNEVRFSYCHVWTPDSIDPNDEPKYSVAILIPKHDTVTLQKIQTAIAAAAEAGKTKLAGPNGQINYNILKTPLRDGDAERPDDPSYVGHYFMNASSKSRPGVVDQNVQPIMNQSEFYSGCYGRASVNFYAFNAKGNKGIACGLNNVQKTRDGEALAGGSSPEEDFTPVAAPPLQGLWVQPLQNVPGTSLLD